MTISYNEAQLVQLAADLRTSMARLDETNQELKGYVTGLLGEWESGASGAYAEAQDKWNSAHASLRDTLGRIAKVVEDGAIDMSGTDKAAASKWM
ncbi:WXG100 family type VII secretion target [Nocardia cyriacigeorgica]|uniref:WXG100 family type VII secretion target n=1 Tax=Nocardia cyriacigeorgica TaxID=135487 RepID=UPI001892D72D|nr:WXG100 family type VII secretion target [Nocardia cyriacigeorgica]MBF6087060.1 WXG100 family type VII secretion target [Nocardia cyriacigeorgica]MBF6319840.1 WXG100 family type VII secretion target [Nocardia cyriacigeorgica]MBF6533537.1 WXG100 family type VII secretion target [Nocardia cyriacigeorgica]